MENIETDMVCGPDLEEILEAIDADVPDFEFSQGDELKGINSFGYEVETYHDEARNVYVMETRRKQKNGALVTSMSLFNIDSMEKAIKYHFGIFEYLEQSRHAREIEEEDYV